MTKKTWQVLQKSNEYYAISGPAIHAVYRLANLLPVFIVTFLFYEFWNVHSVLTVDDFVEFELFIFRIKWLELIFTLKDHEFSIFEELHLVYEQVHKTIDGIAIHFHKLHVHLARNHVRGDIVLAS